MTQDEFTEKMNAMGFGVSSALNIDDELVETVVTVGEKMIKDWSCWRFRLEELLLDDEMSAFMKAVKDYSHTPIKERNHWRVNGV